MANVKNGRDRLRLSRLFCLVAFTAGLGLVPLESAAQFGAVPPPPPVLPYRANPYGQQQFAPPPYGNQGYQQSFPNQYSAPPLPPFCCTQAGRFGPLINPGIPPGGFCSINGPYGPIPGQACY